MKALPTLCNINFSEKVKVVSSNQLSSGLTILFTLLSSRFAGDGTYLWIHIKNIFN